MQPAPPRARRLTAAVAVLALLALGACSRADSGTNPGQARDRGPAAELRLGYFPNITHAAALIGLDKRLFTTELGETRLVPITFNAGPVEVNALLGGSLDAGFIGSGPAINAFARSNGEAVRLIAGAASGGAQLVARPDITTPQDLIGKTVATPQLGNTQDVSLKKWLAELGLTSKVNVTNVDNAQALDAFTKGTIAAAWLPEPWSSRLVLDAGATVLVDEKDRWPGGGFPTTVLVVRTQFLAEHPQTVRALLRGLLAATDLAASDPPGAQTSVNRQLRSLTGKELSAQVIQRAWANVELTVDPIARQFPQLAKDQVTAGVAKRAPRLAGYADLSALNAVLAAAGRSGVDAAGLDRT